MGQPIKIIVPVLAILFSVLMKMDRQPTATVYYISKEAGASNSNSGTSPASPWATISKLNSVTLNPGDQVLFRRGDTWNETFTPNQSGSAGNLITYDAYGTGLNPVITGLVNLPTWTNVGSDTWTAPLAAGSTETMVLVNGALTPPGRFPNTGWLTMEIPGGTSTTQFTTSTPTPSVFTAGGINANAVMKKSEWVTEKVPITSISGQNVNFTNTQDQFPAVNNWGVFFADHPNTLDQQSEWYYGSGTLRMKSFVNPGTLNVKAAVLETILTVNSKNYIKFQNLTFEGSKGNLIEMSGCAGVQFVSCNIRFSGKLGFNSNYLTDFLMTACNVSFTNYSGIDAIFGTNQKFVGNSISYCGMVESLCGPNNKANHGLWANGTGTNIQYNTVSYIGYVGIDFSGSYDTVQNNYVHHAMQKAADGGGIYMSDEPIASGRVIKNNIVLYSLGLREGTPYSGFDNAMGIYLDEHTGYVEISNNLLAYNSGGGIYLHRAHHITMTGNSFIYNTKRQVFMAEDLESQPQKITNLVFTGNTLFTGLPGDRLFTLYGSPDINNFFSSFTNNQISKPSTSSAWFEVVKNYTIFTDYTLAAFRAAYPGYESGSTSAGSDFSTGTLQIFTNPTSSTVTVPLDGVYKRLDGTNFISGSIALGPYGYAAMKRTGDLPVSNTTVNFKGRIIISAP